MANIAITDEADEALEGYIEEQDMPSTKKAVASAAILRLVEAGR